MVSSICAPVSLRPGGTINVPLVALLLLAQAFVSVAARAETTLCTPITTLPAVITEQGIYCLTENLTTSVTSRESPAVWIQANNVTLDLNGWKIGGLAGGKATEAAGIYSDASNVTVKSGIVRGFRNGISLDGRGAVVRDLLVDQSTCVGIYVEGENAVVEGNQVVNTGGSTSCDFAVGVVAAAGGSIVRGNTIAGLEGSVSEKGIYITSPQAKGVLVENNFISDTAPPLTGLQDGIYVWPHSIPVPVSVLGNAIANFDKCIYYYPGGALSPPPAIGLYANNTAMACTTPFTGGTDGGGNASN